jgi:rhamnopyranosyl-N-acetylglucosaminyl-diphospho-decaprenol beta-1,3/1,4-galactofuranosyltransferase
MSVWAAVVTYNRKELLVEGVRAVLGQTRPVDRVVVVDNASSDGTEEHLRTAGLLDDGRVLYHRLAENLGGSGGMSEAVRLGRDGGCEWLWLMDDDSEPRPDALERMLDSPPAADARTVSLAPKVQYPAGGIDANQRGEFRRRLRPLPESAYVPGNYPAIGYTSFVGSLVRTDVARALDLPRGDFFIWGDDVEYSVRLREHGDIRLVPESVILHKRVAHSYMNRRARFWNTVLPITMYPTPIERFWQNLCGLRNYIWIKREYEGQRAVSAAGTAAQFVLKALLYDERPLRRVRWILRFARDGRAGRFANIPPQRWAEMVERGDLR